LDRHFNKVINEIEAGLPSVKVEESKGGGDDDDEDDTFTKATSWTCITCTTQNQMNLDRC
jgi:hypothetical protein